MLNLQSTLNKIILDKAIVIIRVKDSEQVLRIVEAVHRGGLSSIEITMVTPNVLEHIRKVSLEMGDEINIGAGSVLSAAAAQMAIEAGARYIVSPVSKPEIIKAAHQYGAAVIPGAMTPAEILNAHENEADIVKVFPTNILGSEYVRTILGPMPQLRLMPSGGVTIENATDWLKAGSCCLGIGSAVIDHISLQKNDYKQIEKNARKLKERLDGKN